MKKLTAMVMGLAAVGAVRAATCTFNDGWDVAPSGADDEIVIASGSLPWDDTMPAKVASWSQTGGTVTIGTTFDPSVFPFLEVTGDISLTGGTWTHKANSTAKTSRLYVKCGGKMTVGADAVISAEGKGYTKYQSVNGHSDGGTQGGSYGGHGGMATAKGNWTYGSLFAPEDLGNGGGGWNSCTVTGGGSIRLDIAGELVHEGAITASGATATSGQIHYSGAGGSIFIHAQGISGGGTLTANSGVSPIGGGGGRIAVILTGAESDYTNYDIFNLANAHSGKAEARQGGCGTIYAETAADGANHGWLILKGNGYDPSGADANSEWYYADPFSFEMNSANFSKITIAGKTKFYLREGYTLDMTDTKVDIRDAGYGIVVMGGSLVTHDDAVLNIDFPLDYYQAGAYGGTDIVVKDGGVLRTKDRVEIHGNVTVEAGGKVTTMGSSTTPTHKLHLVVGGNMTIDVGGKVDVTSCGYSPDYYPGGKSEDSSGGSHGGWGMRANTPANENGMKPYGSIVDPVTAGAGGAYWAYNSPGGGVAILEIAGKLTVNGSILSEATTAQYYGGAGGSINITAGSLAGAADAVISANGSACTANTLAASGGGRVAVKLTGAGQDFSAYRGVITAYSLGNQSKNRRGGAGTVYLQTAAQGASGGTLIIDNGTAPSSGKTLLGGEIGGTVFGDVIICGGAQAVLLAGSTLTVRGSFTNAATFVAETGSTMVFAGADESRISGNNTFQNLYCATPGKTLVFDAGSAQTVAADITIAGGDDTVTLKSSEKGVQWMLDASGATVSIVGAAIGDCESVGDLVATESEDLGGNGAKVTIQGALEPMTLIWTGAADDVWGNPLNWGEDGRAPTRVDTVIVPATAVSPVMTANAKIAALTVAGTLNVADKSLEIGGTLNVSGSLVATGAADIRVGGDITVTGTVVPSTLTLTANGAAAQVLSFDATTLFAFAVENPRASFAGRGFKCNTLTLGSASGACDYDFAAGFVSDANSFTVIGSAENPNVTMRPASAGGTWTLKCSVSDVTGAIVSGCDASGGVAVVPKNSTDADGNVNWLFDDTRIRWIGGGADVDFATDANWQGGKAPSATDAVVIEGDYTVTVSVPVTVAGLTLGLGAKVTVNAAMTIDGSVAVEPQGALVANAPMAVSGNFAVVDGGLLTHDAIGSTESKKIDLTVGGSGFFAANASVDVTGKGYQYGSSNRGPGLLNRTGDSFTGASYGGCGYHGASTAAPCYGSITNPTNCGTAGGWGGNGGGAVIMSFGGTLTLECDILACGSANGKSHYGSTGGSINLTAATLSGGGNLLANGGTSVTGWNGGGGRIAVRLTADGADFNAYSGQMEALGGKVGLDAVGSPGTIFLKTVADEFGTLRIANQQYRTFEASMDKTDFPATQDNDPAEVKKVTVRLGTAATLNLTADATVSALVFDSNDARILLNGHKLYILGTAKRSVKEFVRSRATPGVDADGNPGEIIWRSGFVLFVR